MDSLTNQIILNFLQYDQQKDLLDLLLQKFTVYIATYSYVSEDGDGLNYDAGTEVIDVFVSREKIIESCMEDIYMKGGSDTMIRTVYDTLTERWVDMDKEHIQKQLENYGWVQTTTGEWWDITEYYQNMPDDDRDIIKGNLPVEIPEDAP